LQLSVVLAEPEEKHFMLFQVYRMLLHQHRSLQKVVRVRSLLWTGWKYQKDCPDNQHRICQADFQRSQRIQPEVSKLLRSKDRGRLVCLLIRH